MTQVSVARSKVSRLIIYHDCAQVFMHNQPNLVLPFEVVDGTVICIQADGTATGVQTLRETNSTLSTVVGDFKADTEIVFLTPQLKWIDEFNVFMKSAEQGDIRVSLVFENLSNKLVESEEEIKLSPKSLLPRQIHYLASRSASVMSESSEYQSDVVDIGLVTVKGLKQLGAGIYTTAPPAFWTKPELQLILPINERDEKNVPVFLHLRAFQAAYAGSGRVTVYGPEHSILGRSYLPNIPVEKHADVRLDMAPAFVAVVDHEILSETDEKGLRTPQNERGKRLHFQTRITVTNFGTWAASVNIRTPSYFEKLKIIALPPIMDLRGPIPPGGTMHVSLFYDVVR